MEARVPNSVLIIEDNADIAECLRYCLELENLETKVAATGEEGLLASLNRDNPPGVILLDVLLPDMSGVELCRRIRSEPSTRSSGILMVSAKALPADIALGLSAGADAYICKPFSVREVVAQVHALLRRAGDRETGGAYQVSGLG